MDVYPTRVGMNRVGQASFIMEMEYTPREWGGTAIVNQFKPCRLVYPTRVGMNRCTSPPPASNHSVYPTRVGMNRPPQSAPGRRSCIPHASGDEPSFPFKALKVAVVYPTRVGMNRRGGFLYSLQDKYTPREWG